MEENFSVDSVPASPTDSSKDGEVGSEGEGSLRRSNKGFQPRGPVASGILPVMLCAADTGNIEILNFWLNGRTDVNEVTSAGQTGLMLAAANGHLSAVSLLCDRGADLHLVDRDGKTALLYASMHGHEEIVYLLQEQGSDVKVVDKSGSTALIYATLIGNMNLVRFMFDHGCDINHRDNFDFTAVMYAARDGHRDVVKFLCKRGADLDAKERKSGRSALTLATSKNFPEVVKVLCNSGARLDDTVKTGMTALHIAAVQGHTDIVRVLLTAGASLKLKDRSSNTPEDLARSSGHLEVEQILQEAKKDRSRSRSRSWKGPKAKITFGFRTYVKIVQGGRGDVDEEECRNPYVNVETRAQPDPYQNMQVGSADLILNPGITPRVVEESSDLVIYEDYDFILRQTDVPGEGTQAAQAAAAPPPASTTTTTTTSEVTVQEDRGLRLQIPSSAPPPHPLQQLHDLAAAAKATGPSESSKLAPKNQLLPPPVLVYSPPPYPSQSSNPPINTAIATGPLHQFGPTEGSADTSPKSLDSSQTPRTPRAKLARAEKTYRKVARETSGATSSLNGSSSRGTETMPPPVPEKTPRSFQHQVDAADAYESTAAAAAASPPPLPLGARHQALHTEANVGATSPPGMENSELSPGPAPPLPPPWKSYDSIVRPVYETVKKCLEDFEREHEQGCYRQHTSCTTSTSENDDDHVTLIVNVNFCSHHRVNCQTLNVQNSEFMATNQSTMNICRGCRLRKNCPDESEDGELTDDDVGGDSRPTSIKTPYCAESFGDDEEEDSFDDGPTTYDDVAQTFVKQTRTNGPEEDDGDDDTFVKTTVSM